MPDPVVDPPAPDAAPAQSPPPPPPPPPPPAGPSRIPEQFGEGPFTQEQVNKILAGARYAQRPPDYDDLKAAAAKLAEIEAANQTELERAQKERDALKAERDAALERAKTTALRATVIAEASKAGAVDPDDVFALLPKDAVTVGDDGQVTGATDAIKALLEAKPHLVGKPNTPTGTADGGPQGTPGPAQLSRDDLKTMSAEQIEAARESGQLKTLLGHT